MVHMTAPLEDLLLFFKQLTELGSYFGYTVNAPKCQLIVKEASKINAHRLFEGTAVESVDGYRTLGSVIDNVKAYETFKATTAGMYANLFKKLRTSSKNIPSKLLRMLHKRRATKIKFLVQDNAKISEYLQMQKPTSKARPTVVL